MRADALRLMFQYTEELLSHSVWTYFDTQERPDGKKEYPRFIAAIEDDRTFQWLLQERKRVAEELQEARVTLRWLPTFFDERWSHASVRVTDAFRSWQFTDGVDLPCEPVRKDNWELEKPLVLEKVEALLASPLPVRKWELLEDLDETGNFVCPVLQLTLSAPLALRQPSGKSFRLYGVSVDGVQHKNVKVGIVVLRGLEGKVQVNVARKPRTDRKEQVAEGFGFQFFR